jgi:hypothetical protein
LRPSDHVAARPGAYLIRPERLMLASTLYPDAMMMLAALIIVFRMVWQLLHF